LELVATIVELSLTLSDDIETFDSAAQEGLEASLAETVACHEPGCFLQLLLSAGSITVKAVFTIPTGTGPILVHATPTDGSSLASSSTTTTIASSRRSHKASEEEAAGSLLSPDEPNVATATAAATAAAAAAATAAGVLAAEVEAAAAALVKQSPATLSLSLGVNVERAAPIQVTSGVTTTLIVAPPPPAPGDGPPPRLAGLIAGVVIGASVRGIGIAFCMYVARVRSRAKTRPMSRYQVPVGVPVGLPCVIEA